jgi:hypothetical protein
MCDLNYMQFEAAVDYYDVDCEDCGHKFFVGPDYNFQQENAKRCTKCKRIKIEFEAEWAKGPNGIYADQFNVDGSVKTNEQYFSELGLSLDVTA